MVINNQDYQTIGYAEGIFQTNPVNIPDGYAAELMNLLIHDGIVEARGSFRTTAADSNYQHSATQGWAGSAFQLPPAVINLQAAAGRTLLAGFIATYPGAARGNLIGILNESLGTPRVVRWQPPATIFWGGLAVYNQTLYSGAQAGVVKLDVSNYPTAVVETAIPASPDRLIGMFAHKSRMWGWKTNSNRLYFTDAPAVGALPETWNLAVNFIDVVGVGSTVIRAAIPLNNYVYIFTNYGLFSLYTVGAPSNWILKVINPDIRVFNPQSVVTRNGLIYYVTETGVYVTDGFEFKLLSQTLTDEFYGQYEISHAVLQAFDGGLLLGAYSVFRGKMRIYHTKLNKIAWTAFTIPTINSAAASSEATNPPYLQAIEIPATSHSGKFESWVMSYMNNPPFGGVETFLLRYEPTIIGQDHLVTYDLAGLTWQSLQEFQVEMTLRTRHVGDTNFMRTKKFQDIFLIIGGQKSFTIGPSAGGTITDGVNFNVPNNTDVVSPHYTGVLTRDGYLLKGSMIRHGYSIQVEIKLKLVDDATEAVQYRTMTLGALGITTILESTATWSTPGVQ